MDNVFEIISLIVFLPRLRSILKSTESPRSPNRSVSFRPPENVGDIRGQLMTEKGQSPLFNAIQSESSQVDSMQGVDVVVDDSFSFGTFLYGELKQQANTLIEKLPKDYRAEHREEVWRITYVAMTIEGASLVKQWVRGIVRNKPGHVVDYLLGCVRKGCEQRKLDWQSIRARAPQCPPEPKPRILPLTSA